MAEKQAYVRHAIPHDAKSTWNNISCTSHAYMLHACMRNNVPCMLCSTPGPFQLLPEHTVNSEGMQCTVEHCTGTFGLRLQNQAVSGIAACLIGLVPVPFAIAFILKYVPLLCTCPSCHWLPTPFPAYTSSPPPSPSPHRHTMMAPCAKGK